MRLGHPLSTSGHEQQDRLTKGRRVIWLSRARFHEGPRQNNSKLHQSRQEKISYHAKSLEFTKIKILNLEKSNDGASV